ncbi:hydroxymethylglutaryl-CoA lyase [Celeribacter sp. PS-C1]|uniref:hydroxymethylglutaryl-CoA lyase n=1 Tax=Celeribacter sp. PS-C1 TaxID=2820813 RepID=UPI001C67E4F2|nr:hydroxymethylglutaryl-CoA lyase [Celeribacter sp. PS-C1]MBW6417030.1 hydroxymethylglutaryl-CoA lyase [Celeribacter sp. PS-C1]
MSVTLCECFARDGLQHETVEVPTGTKVKLIDAMTAAGFPRIEVTSYSHPGRVPVFGDASAVLAKIKRRGGIGYKATCPNERAVSRALEDFALGHGATEISFLASATESHTERNLRTTRDGQWVRIEEMSRLAGDRFTIVGVLSVALGCPFEGSVDPGRVVEDAARFAEVGATLLTVGDTVGTGTPSTVRHLFRRLIDEVPGITPVAHFHDTRGTGLANCMAAFDAGCTHFDSAFGGVGGHPTQISYGQGRTGNVATEDLVSLLEAEGVATGIDLDAMMRLSECCENALGRQLDSKVARAGLLPAAA